MATPEQAAEMFDRLLVPLDGSPLAERAISYACALARPGTEITLIEVVPEAGAVAGPFGLGGVSAEEIQRFDREAAERFLDAVAGGIRAGGSAAKVHLAVEVGEPATGILRAAGERRAGLIVMASHGRGALGRFAFGSIADRVARAAEIPVLIVRAQDRAQLAGVKPIRRLVVPLDGSARAARALPTAAALARRLAIPIQVVCAVDAARVAFVTTAPDVFAAVLSGLREEAQQTAAEAAKELAAAGLGASGTLVEGPAAAAIANATQDGDVIVMTSHGRGGVTRWVLGSVAEKLVREGPVPVLLVKGDPVSPTPPSRSDAPASESAV